MLKTYALETLLMLVAGGLAAYFFPWWAIAVAAGLIAVVFSKKNWISFAAGLTAGLLIWWSWGLMIDIQNDAILSTRIGQLFKGLTSGQLLLATGLVGALLSSMGALTGASLKRLFKKQPKPLTTNKVEA